MSMALHVAKVSVISSNVGRSESRSAPSVSSENTTPHPYVASGGFRSITLMSCEGSAFFMSRLKYSPAGPAPRVTMRIGRPSPLGWLPSAQDFGEPVELLEVGHGGEQDQLVTAGLFIATDDVDDGLGSDQVRRGDLLGERPGERVVVTKVVGARADRVLSEREIALAGQ